jgi:hypothetical protein
VNYYKLLETALFISSSTFLGVVKLYVFKKKILGTLEDALTFHRCTSHKFVLYQYLQKLQKNYNFLLDADAKGIHKSNQGNYLKICV